VGVGKKACAFLPFLLAGVRVEGAPCAKPRGVLELGRVSELYWVVLGVGSVGGGGVVCCWRGALGVCGWLRVAHGGRRRGALLLWVLCGAGWCRSGGVCCWCGN